ncbi:hypothetical protein C5D09_06305 [Rathayibacter sp. AY1C9]|uniref:hypothetical protein n=1 Tax=Rathayibacter sp. AY1C9 TaxID=2080541 RepID=UPI000CE8B912|nr:hypothetical protein [Rathayibacter sp. AY1C9]PPH46988.1 hypothetical protein C5D09_06305 [Rathayibacter sp. AY1C9]
MKTEPRQKAGVIVRTKLSFETHFTQIPNAYARDNRMSYKARGILVLLMSHAPGTPVSLQSLADDSDPDGLTAVRTGVMELEQHGYLSREPVREGSGVYGTRWHLTEPTIPLFEGDGTTASENRTRSPKPVDNSRTASENRMATASENRTQRRTLLKNTYRTTQDNPSTRTGESERQSRTPSGDAFDVAASLRSAAEAIDSPSGLCGAFGAHRKVHHQYHPLNGRCIHCGERNPYEIEGVAFDQQTGEVQ